MLPQLRCREMRHPLVLLLRAFCGSLCLCACFASKCMHFLKDITIYAPMFVSIYAYLCTAHTHAHNPMLCILWFVKRLCRLV